MIDRYSRDADSIGPSVRTFFRTTGVTSARTSTSARALRSSLTPGRTRGTFLPFRLAAETIPFVQEL